MLAYARYVPQINIGKFGDFSYGLYLYAYQVQQSLIHWVGADMNPWMLVMYTTAISLPLAMISWFAIESPALQLRQNKRHMVQ